MAGRDVGDRADVAARIRVAGGGGGGVRCSERRAVRRLPFAGLLAQNKLISRAAVSSNYKLVPRGARRWRRRSVQLLFLVAVRRRERGASRSPPYADDSRRLL